MEAILHQSGFVRAEPNTSADLEIVHSCSVTTAAARQSRQAYRRARRDQRPGQAAMLTGCYATTNPSVGRRLTGSTQLLIGHDTETPLLQSFARQLNRWLTNRQSNQNVRDSSRFSSNLSQFPTQLLPQPSIRGRHIRAEVMIQDGCDAHCTFCIIPKIRRILRSKSIASTLLEVQQLVELGHREIVLTGIFLGAYGHETSLRRRQSNPDAEHLADLLHAVAQVPQLERLRLSSLEPGDVTPSLLEAMVANAPVVVPHLHLPLQSGADRILRRMNRQYTVGAYREMISMVNEALTLDDLPPAITTDIICGFPGESEREYLATRSIVEEAGFLHLHVFPYSSRTGTAASRWTNDHIDPVEVKRRVRDLIDLERHPHHGLSIRFRRRLQGRTVRLIVEQRDADQPSMVNGRCDHYVRVRFPAARVHRGRTVQVRVKRITPTATEGELIPTPIPLPILA